jgi:hypothetical protein
VSVSLYTSSMSHCCIILFQISGWSSTITAKNQAGYDDWPKKKLQDVSFTKKCSRIFLVWALYQNARFQGHLNLRHIIFLYVCDHNVYDPIRDNLLTIYHDRKCAR